MGLPPKLTHEEQALLNKFALLKKKKKVLQTPKNTAVESNNKKTAKIAKKESAIEPVKAKVVAPKDAKEIAKRLIASGQVKLNKNNENRSFKRVRTQGDKKSKEPSEVGLVSKEQIKKITDIKKESYKNFVASRGENKDSDDISEPTKDVDTQQHNNFGKRRQQGGNSLFIQGYGLTKAILESSFPPFGSITNLHMDYDKGNGTVTFADKESAENAIAELHGSMIQGVTLRVTYSRRRPYDDNRYTYRPKSVKPDGDQRVHERQDLDRQPSDTSATASTLKSPIKKESNNKRKLLNYDEEGFDF